MKQSILLSITILVSGRRETTSKCLDSLEHLREEIPCQLVLVDTGCPEDMRIELKQRADQVIEFAWCNDFAKARNAGLQASEGRWVMFMDDDEWFEDTTELEHFFLSGEYKKFQSASYVVRNYANDAGTVWRDAPIVRMVQRRQDTRFFYPIHEVLWPVLEPVRHLADYVHHFGYASEDPQIQLEKRRRNISLLLPAIEKDPHCMHHYLQTVIEYVAAEDYEKALQVAENGIAHCDMNRADNGNFIQGLYAAVVKLSNRLEQYERAYALGQDILKNRSLTKLAKAAILGELTIASSQLTYYTESRSYAKEYLSRKQFFKMHPDKWNEQQTLILDACFEDYQYRKIMGNGFVAFLAGDTPAETEVFLSMEETSWWLETIQRWYTLAAPVQRQTWQQDMERSEKQGGEQYPMLHALYQAVTVSEQQPDQAEQEMEALAIQLKGKIHELMEQGQYEAAASVIQQLLQYLPQDRELLDMKRRCL